MHHLQLLKALGSGREGLLDLSDWSFTEDGPVVLGGEWDFWWGELLTDRPPNGLFRSRLLEWSPD